MSETDQPPAPAPESVIYVLKEVLIEGICNIFHRYKRYAKLEVDGSEVLTLEKLKVEGGTLRWQGLNNTKHFTAKPLSTVNFSLYKTNGGKSRPIGTINSLVLTSLVERGRTAPLSMKIKSKRQKGPILVTLVICKEEVEGDGNGELSIPLSALALEVHKADLGVSQMRIPGMSAQIISNGVQIGEGAYESMLVADETWGSLLQGIDSFVKFMDGIAEIHPYAKLAWSMLSEVYQAYKRQIALDEKVMALAEKIRSAYSTLLEHHHLRALADGTDNDAIVKARHAIQSHKKTLQSLTIRTFDCALAISKYTNARHFVTRLMIHLLESTSQELDNFSEQFDELNRKLREQSIFSSERMNVQILGDLGEIQIKLDLRELENICVPRAQYRSDRTCFEGTRGELLDKIKGWKWDANKVGPNPDDSSSSGSADVSSTNSSVKHVYLLFGEAGTGKSAIANTIADYFYETKPRRLGASYRFSAAWGTQSEHITPGEIAKSASEELLRCAIPTLAWQLAQSNHFFRAALWRGLCSDPSSASQMYDLQKQFDRCLLQPAEHIPAAQGPIYIVIDALDEICRIPERKVLLKVLANGLSRLPTNFRILLTARPEQDIHEAFENSRGTLPIWIPRVDQDQALLLDVQKVIRHSLADVAEKARLEESDYAKLAEMSQGLFQWARVACDHIIGDGRGNNGTPRERYEALVKTTENAGGARLRLLDSLYEYVIPLLVNLNTAELKARFNRVMGLLLHTYEPLTMDAIRSLAEHVAGCTAKDVENILPYLGPFLSGVSGTSVPVLPIHSSFRDSLVEHGHSNSIYIGAPTKHHADLVSSCLRLVTDGSNLHFNMCDLKTSYLLNRDVPDLIQRIESSIPFQVSYACRFWGKHILQLTSRCFPTLIPSLKVLLENKFLFWLEALSLLGAVSEAAGSLSSIIPLLAFHDPQLSSLAYDALQFVLHQSRAISDSAPHIYLSALMSSPSQSLVRKLYLQQHPQTAHVYRGHRQQWPATRDSTQLVFSVATMQYCEQVVSGIMSGSLDNLSQMGYADAGETSGVLCEVHNNVGPSRVFCDDSKQFLLCSYDTTTGLRDGRVGNVVCSVAFSHDWSRIASGSIDKTIWIWDKDKEGVQTPELLVGHTGAVLSVAFSPDNKLLVSGSADTTIQLWDLETSKPIGRPLVGHEAAVNCVIFSKDGTWIASGSDDRSVMIWETRAGVPVRQPLQGHTEAVMSVAFSSDDKQIISRSADKTIIVWDRRTGRRLSERHWNHTCKLMPVTFSPHSKPNISGSASKTIQSWDLSFRHDTSVEEAQGCKDRSSSSAFSVDKTKWWWWWWWPYLESGKRDGSRSTGPPWISEEHEPVDATVRSLADLFISITRDLGRVVPGPGEKIRQTVDVAVTSHYNAFCLAEAHQPKQPYIPEGGKGAHLSIDRSTGWIKYDNIDYFLWLPPDMLERACIPPCLNMRRNDEMVFLDLSQFVHGERWTECCRPVAA